VNTWESVGHGGDQFNKPAGIAVNGTGCVYIADTGNDQLQSFTLDGQYSGTMGTVQAPTGIAVNSSGYVYVLCGNSVQVYTSDGNNIFEGESYGSGDGQLIGAEGIAINSSGYVYIADTGNDRVQVFYPNCTFLAKWGATGNEDGNFSGPTGIAVNSSGYVYVADTYNQRVEIFTATGQFVSAWGSSQGGNAMGLQQPAGIAVNGTGYVYVADIGSNAVEAFTSTGQFLFAIDGQFHMTEGIAVNSGTFHTNSTVVFNGPEGIAVDSSGHVFVADTGNNRVEEFAVGDLPSANDWLPYILIGILAVAVVAMAIVRLHPISESPITNSWKRVISLQILELALLSVAPLSLFIVAPTFNYWLYTSCGLAIILSAVILLATNYKAKSQALGGGKPEQKAPAITLRLFKRTLIGTLVFCILLPVIYLVVLAPTIGVPSGLNILLLLIAVLLVAWDAHYRFLKPVLQNLTAAAGLETGPINIGEAWSAQVRKTILELGTKYTRLQIAEIAEMCGIPSTKKVQAVVEDMIQRGQIAAKYFASTQAVAFDQQANTASWELSSKTGKVGHVEPHAAVPKPAAKPQPKPAAKPKPATSGTQDYHGTPLNAPEHEFMAALDDLLGKSVPVATTVELDTFGFIAQGGHVTQLGLYEQGLASLPETLGQLSQLEELTLYSNQLVSLPETLGQLSELKNLRLYNNQLKSLPETLGNLNSLANLDLSANQLVSLPETLGQLSQLKELALYNNQLVSLPKTLLRLNALTNLYIDKRLAGDRVAKALEKRKVSVQEM